MAEQPGQSGIQDSPRKGVKLRIAICVPTRGMNYSGFTYDLGQLIGYSTMTLVNEGVADIGLVFGDNSYIHRNRNDLAQHVVEKGYTHALFLDDDMKFPKDTLLRLLKHRLPIVGVNYPTRRIPFTPTAIKRSGLNGEEPERLGFTDEPLEEVDALGFGVVLIEASVFTSMPWPWFESYREEDNWIGEDFDFCRKAKSVGYRVMVDQELSREVAHIGTFEFGMNHTEVFAEDIDGA